MTTRDDIVIRRSTGRDEGTLRRLAELDSTSLPSDDYLLAEVGGTALAAVGIARGGVAADPFHPTAELIELLRIRAERIRQPVAARRPRHHGLSALLARSH